MDQIRAFLLDLNSKLLPLNIHFFFETDTTQHSSHVVFSLLISCFFFLFGNKAPAAMDQIHGLLRFMWVIKWPD